MSSIPSKLGELTKCSVAVFAATICVETLAHAMSLTQSDTVFAAYADLGANSLSGTILTELGLLTNLGE